MKRKAYYILTLLGCMLMLAACNSDDSLADSTNTVAAINDEEEGLCDIEISSRSAMVTTDVSGTEYQDTTYRAQLFYRSNNDPNYWQRQDSLITPYTGTYCMPKGSNTYLTPCAVETTNYTYDSSADPAEDSKYGLRAGRNHDYYLFINSPAVPYVHVASQDVVKTNPNASASVKQATLEYWGLQYLRDGAATTHPAVSPGAKVTTSGVNLQSTYKYNLSDTMKLKEYRSRIAFSVRCGDAITHTYFKKLEIKGLRKNSVLQPFTKKFYFEDKEENYEDVTVYECSDAAGVRLDRGGTEGAYEPGESQSLIGLHSNDHLKNTQENTYFTYVLCEDYKSLKKVGDTEEYINTPASMYITLADDAGVTIDVDPVLMPFIFEPQKNYFYMITINSVYLAVTVTTRSWDTAYTVSETIDDDPGETFTFTIKDWTTHANTTSVEKGEGGGSSDPATINTSTGSDKTHAEDWNTQKGGDSTVE